jgi:hypothetical protein
MLRPDPRDFDQEPRSSLPVGDQQAVADRGELTEHLDFAPHRGVRDEEVASKAGAGDAVADDDPGVLKRRHQPQHHVSL